MHCATQDVALRIKKQWCDKIFDSTKACLVMGSMQVFNPKP